MSAAWNGGRALPRFGIQGGKLQQSAMSRWVNVSTGCYQTSGKFHIGLSINNFFEFSSVILLESFDGDHAQYVQCLKCC